MKRLVPLIVLALSALPSALSAQSAPPNFLQEFQGQFEASARKFVALAEAMPADKYSWAPDEGVMSVVRVYMHVASYNYMYPDEVLGIDPGEGDDYGVFESTVTSKEQALSVLTASMDHVRRVVKEMDVADLEKPAVLYGREVGQWAVLLQLVTHMNEHLGQSIAYARMNGVVPPWSR